MIILEALVLLGVVVGVVYLLGKFLKGRERLKLIREQRAACREAAREAKDVARELMLDREMAEEVYCELGRHLGKHK
ncbi:hypothetical protein KKF05_01250 [Patescibacteria group bacterium]|nr:hypothetical protein [Patescibacteria group bacterium]MBU1028850.1 hypothetical protein [Patescibacteria group bacterium]MBU1916188.1 hypothetical protein [Patescibacteria group bacterium]